MAKLEIELVGGQKAGETLQTLRKELSVAAKEMNKLELGSKEFAESSKRYNEIKDRMKTVTSQTQATNAASEQLKTSFGGILNQIPGFSQLKGAFDQAAGGVGGLSSGLRSMIAIPVIAVLAGIAAIIGTVYAAIKTDDETADEFGKKWDQISAIFDVVLRRIGMVGKALVNFLKGDFSKGFDQIKDSVAGVGDELQRAWDLSGQLADRQNQLEDDVNRFNASEQALKNTIDQLIVQSKDRTKTEAERIALETQAETLLQKLTKDRMALAERQSAIDIEAIGLKHNLQRQLNETTQDYGMRLLENSTIGGDEAKKISAAIKSVDEAQAESIRILEKLQNQRNALLEKRAEDQRKADEKFLRDAEKFEADKAKIQADQDAFNEAREANNLKKIEDRAKASMVAALTDLQKKNAIYKEDQANFEAVENAKRAIEQESLEVFNEGTNSIIGLLGATAAARKKNAFAIKALESGQVVVNGVREVSEIAKTFATLGPAGQVLAAFRIAFAVARTAAGLQRINAQKFALGGPVYGPSHSGGGVPIEAEGGEFIFSRKAVKAIGVNTLNSINKKLTFAQGGMVPSNPFDRSRGPISSGTAAQSTGDSMAGVERLENSILALANAMDQRIDRIEVVNSLQQTEKGLATLKQLKSEWDV